MSQILLIENEEAYSSILKLNMMRSIGCEVIVKDNLEDALALIAILPEINLIICRELVNGVALPIATFLQKEKNTIPLLIIGNKLDIYEHIFNVDSDPTWQNIVIAAGKIVGVKVDFNLNKIGTDFASIPLNYFFNINSPSMGCDVYIRVKKGEADYQYIKRLHSSDQFNRVDIEKYRDSGLKELYIPKDHFTQFVNYVTDQFILKLDDQSLKNEERIILSSDAYEITLDRIHSIGVDDTTVALVEESVKAMLTSVKEANALSSFLALLNANKLSYAYSHCYLTSLILHKVVERFDWKTAQIKEKLTYISYFHDISLRNEEMMKIHSNTQLDTMDLNKDDKTLVLNHALLSAEIVERFPSVPTGVGTILREHHGSKTGLGFPESLSIAIAPISMMFVVTEDFVDRFLRLNNPPTQADFEEIFKEMESRYTKLTYAQTLLAIQNMTNNKK